MKRELTKELNITVTEIELRAALEAYYKDDVNAVFQDDRARGVSITSHLVIFNHPEVTVRLSVKSTSENI